MQIFAGGAGTSAAFLKTTEHLFMRILQVITELRPAGAERIVQTLSSGLTTAGHEVKVVSLRPQPKESFIVDRLKAAKIPVESLNVTKATPWRLARIRRTVSDFRPDIVHAHLIHANLATRLFRPSSVPLVNTLHIAERRPGKTWHFFWTV
jgi:hypothetical protein